MLLIDIKTFVFHIRKNRYNSYYFLATKVDDVITLKVLITAGIASLFLALGVPRCS